MKSDLDYFMKRIFMGLVLRIGSRFLLDPTLNTNPKPHLQKVLLCRHPCHTWDLKLGTMCEVESPNIHALNGWDCTNWPQVTWDLVWSGKSQRSCSQRLRLHRSTSSDLGLNTRDLVWSGKSQRPCSQWWILHGLTSSELGPRVKWGIPTFMLSTAEIARIDLKWLGT